MKQTLLIGLLFILTLSSAKAQDCFKYFPSKKGTSLEYTSYDKKDKVTGVSVRTVLDKRTSGDSVIVDYQVKTTPTDADTTIVSEFSMSCVDDKLYVNMGSSVSSSMYAAYPGMTLKVSGTDLDMPTNPTVGQALDNGSMTVQILNNGTSIMTIKSDVTNRKVAAVETITIPAGTFKTFKITYDIKVSMGFMTSTGSVAEWYTEKYGIIKSENYDKRGKLDTYEVLSKIISD